MKQILVSLVKPRYGVYFLCVLTLVLSTATPSFAQGPVHTTKWLCDTGADAHDRGQKSQNLWHWANAAIYYTAYVERDSAEMRKFLNHRRAVLGAWQRSLDVIWNASAAARVCSGSEAKIKEECTSEIRHAEGAPAIKWEIHSDETLIQMADNAYNSAKQSGSLWDWLEAARYYTAYIERDPAAMYRSAQFTQQVLAAKEASIRQVLVLSQVVPRLIQPCARICPESESRVVNSLQSASNSLPAPGSPYTSVYQEDFDDGQAQAWDLEPGWMINASSLIGNGHKWARYTEGNWYDAHVRFKVMITKGSGIHFNYRDSDKGRYYIGFREGVLYLSKEAPPRTFHKDLVRSSDSHTPGVWYDVAIWGDGPRIRVAVNNVWVLDYTDPDPLLSGTIGFVTLEGSQAAVDNIKVFVPYAAPIQLEAEEYIEASRGVAIDRCSEGEGGSYLGWINNGEWVRFKNVDFGSVRSRTINARVASATSGGEIEIRLDSVNGERIAVCQVRGTGGWQNWATVSCGLTGNLTGMRPVYLVFRGGDTDLFNVNWIEFVPTTL